MDFLSHFIQKKIVLIVQAANDLYGLNTTASQGFGELPSADPIVITGRIVNSLLGLLGVFFVILIIVGGMQWMNSQGNDEQIKKAQSLIKNALIGLIVVLAAYTIAWFIMETFIPTAFNVTPNVTT